MTEESPLDPKLNQERDEAVDAIAYALLEGMRCSSQMDTLEDVSATDNEIDYVKHVLVHSVQVMQWAFMRDAASLVDKILLDSMNEPAPKCPAGYKHSAEEWDKVIELIRDQTIHTLEYVGSEFRTLSKNSLTEGQL